MLDSLLLGDCLDIMPTLADQSIDCVMCDLPYALTANHWDSLIPLEPLWAQYKRLLKPGGAVVLTASQPFTSVLVLSNPAWFRHEWIWLKESGTGHLNAQRAPLKAHESVLAFCDKQPTYHPQRRPGAAYIRPSGRKGSSDYGSQHKVITHNERGRYPLTYLFFPRDTPRIHPTQKPEKLFEYMLNTYSSPGDTVLDSCAGSCTTAVACIETGRHYICIEKDAGYLKTGQQRVAAAQQQAQGGPLFVAS